MSLKINLLATAIIIALSGCQEPSNSATDTTETISEQSQLVSGVLIDSLDKNTRPQDDFYQFANGGWLNKTEIPEIYSGYTIYHEVYEDAEKTLREIIESSASREQKKGSEAQKVGDLFSSWMDERAIDAKGLTPLSDDLNAIQAINSNQQLVAVLADFIRKGIEVPMAFYVSQDVKKSTEYTVYFWQDGLTLANRDYYLEQDNENFAKAREGLPAFIKDMVSFVDPTVTTARAQAVFDLETKMAEHHWTQVANRDDEKTYNAYAKEELATLGSNIDWVSMLSDLGIGQSSKVIISQPDYFTALDQMVKEVDVQVWKDYLAYNLIRANSSHLTKAVDATYFNFMSKTLKGQSKQQPRWKRGVSLVSRSLGEAIGKLYVEQKFPAEAKTKMNELVANVLAVYDSSIDGLEWMSADTKKAAKLKRSKFTSKVGYPDVWRDYSSLDVMHGDHFGNMQRSRAYSYNRMIKKLGTPIDRNEWHMTPQTVNAYYSPSSNEIVFPAARLQPPFFQLNADDAINYGAIGGVIGHEISHGFDDSGSKYDGDGNLKNWWTEADRNAFEQRTNVLVEQYNQFSPIDGMTVNGELTLGENIGDLSGVAMAYKAYLLSLNGKEAPIIDGFTGPQRFFIGYAMSRKGKYKDEATVSRLASDPHSPLKFRVNGVYQNIDAFHEAFNTKEGDGMWLAPEKRVKIW